MTRRDERRPADDGGATTAGERHGAAPDLAVVPGASRAGEDARRRGWFWHWNSLVTQYAPLIGLKGVGLLNSYTVWTDRREESPHRGYAFPSQQREADFYGEDRAELIAINKILVALDLVEIRKEMVLRTDPQGRRWKVPHNFYRVKDHDDSFTLSAADVLRVAALADTDKTVYRYVRRVFSPRFAPIDGDNPWHRILPEVRQTPLWQKLATRAAAEEGRASARTKAGHAARRAQIDPAEAPTGHPSRGDFFVPEGGDTPADLRVDSASPTVATPPAAKIIVDGANDGLAVDVAGCNTGSAPPDPTSVGPLNSAGVTAVDGTNTTYHQRDSTTTTGTANVKRGSPGREQAEPQSDMLRPELRQLVPPGAGAVEMAGGPSAPPSDAGGTVAAVRAFQEANNRPITPAERKLLAELATRFEPAAAAVGVSGWRWVAVATYEAVEAGSAFVAPRRLREIMTRWEREGYPHDDTQRRAQPSERGDAASPLAHPRTAVVRLAGGRSATQVWHQTLGLLAGSLDRAALAAVSEGSAIVGERNGEITIVVADEAAAERLATGYAGLIGRKLADVLRRPLRVRFVAAGEPPDPPPGPLGRGPSRLPAETGTAPLPAPFVVAECGLGSGAVWSAMLAELATAGVGRGEIDAWLRPGALLGRGGEGGLGAPLVIGLPHDLARRRVAGRHLPALRSAAAALGLLVEIELAVTREWLAARATADPGSDALAAGGQYA